MDFGFSRILEMFEERFGRTATTVLIAVICVAIFFYSIHVAIDAVIEIRKAIVDWEWFTEKLLDILMRSMLGIVIIWVAADALCRYYFVPLIKQWEASTAAVEAKIELGHKRATELEARLEERVAALNKRSDAVMKRMDEIKAQFKQKSDVLKVEGTQFESGKTGE